MRCHDVKIEDMAYADVTRRVVRSPLHTASLLLEHERLSDVRGYRLCGGAAACPTPCRSEDLREDPRLDPRPDRDGAVLGSPC